MTARRQQPPATGESIDLLNAMYKRLYDAACDPSCHYRDLGPITRRLQEVAEDITEYENTRAALQRHLKLLVKLKSILGDAVDDPECAYRDLATLTRRLQVITKEIVTIREKLSQREVKGGGARSDEKFDSNKI